MRFHCSGFFFCWCQSIGCYSIRRRSTFYANFHGRVSSRMLRLLFSKRCFNDFLMVEMNAQFSMWQLPGNSTLLHKKHSGQTCSSSSLIYYFIALLLTLVKFLLWCFYAHRRTIECYSWKSVIIWWLFCQKQPRKQGIRVGRLLLVQVTLRLVRMTLVLDRKAITWCWKVSFCVFWVFFIFFCHKGRKIVKRVDDDIKNDFTAAFHVEEGQETFSFPFFPIPENPETLTPR